MFHRMTPLNQFSVIRIREGETVTKFHFSKSEIGILVFLMSGTMYILLKIF